jgi:hypothetical protein
MLSSARAWLDEPKSRAACIIAWVASGAAFVGITAALGGPSLGDSQETQFTSWSFAHGQFACAYLSEPHFIQEGPLYALLSAPFDWIFRVGGSVAFPSGAQLGPHCTHALSAVSFWADRSLPLNSSLLVGYLVWFTLLFGLVALLRACDRGRCGWEIVTVVAVALTPPVFMCLQEDFHPEDLLCMGLVLGGLACIRRGRWGWSGVLTGLAVAAQPFGLLAIAPLIMLATGRLRLRFAVAALASVAAVYVPVGIATDGRSFSILTGASVTLGGWSVLGRAHLHGTALVLISRILPIVCSMGLALWFRVRLGARTLEPVPLIALIGLSFACRLVFEVNLFSYYFLGLAVSIVLLQVLEGKLYAWTIPWLAAVAIAFYPIWAPDQVRLADLVWLFQIVLVSSGIALVAATLRSDVRAERKSVALGAFDPPAPSRTSGAATVRHVAANLDPVDVP